MPPPTLLSLPPELRLEIYSYLIEPGPISYPFNYTPVTSITHRPPPSALQRTCRFLHSEVQSYYYSICVLSFVVWSTPRRYYEPHVTAALRKIRLAKVVDVKLSWDFAAQREETNIRNSKEALGRMVKLLQRHAVQLEVVMVSVKDMCDEIVGCDVKASLLAPLNDFKGKVNMIVGEIIVMEDEKEDEVKIWLQKHLRALNSGKP